MPPIMERKREGEILTLIKDFKSSQPLLLLWLPGCVHIMPHFQSVPGGNVQMRCSCETKCLPGLCQVSASFIASFSVLFNSISLYIT